MRRFASNFLPFLIGVAIVAVLATIAWPRDADPEYSVTIPYRAWWAMDTIAPDGELCYMFDHSRHFTVADAENTVIATEVLHRPGVYRQASDGRWHCEVTGSVLVPESDHYLVTFNDNTRYVVERDDLGDRYLAPWVELTRPAWTPPFASPEASPTVSSSVEG